ncbi:MAG: HAMP domain-containing sensor histidine kinase [Bacteroidota bacterium]|nr:HAMP domain-containing sensor histidine kinase [Bacteroidota bacterium]
MNRKIIIFIIILMTLALFGLMVVQVYWIRNAISVRQANFTVSINEVAANISFKLEKLELARQLELKISSYYQIHDDRQIVDTMDILLLEKLQSIKNRAELEDFFNRYFLAEGFFEDLLDIGGSEHSVHVIEESLLDSLISDELNKKSIKAKFQFGVFRSSTGNMIIQKPKGDPILLLDKGYAYSLNPSSLEEKPDYLILYFPNERTYLISQMWRMLFISILLILIIIFSFLYTIFTIIKQKKLSVMKNDFINNMTHEFKTPISTISLACQAMNDEDIAKSDHFYQNYVGIIYEENSRLGSMAEKILQSAILDKGQIHLKKDYFDLHEVISNVVRKIGFQVEIKDGKINMDFHAKPSIIHADKVHITNMINNLLDNANKYTPQKPMIRVSTVSQKNGVVISVVDNGIGICKANQKKIFDKLYRVPTGDVHDFKGFGLGLSYVKAIVDLHRGNIRLESELKKGTKFDVFLPYESKF